ncbi:MAG: VirK/YbjX family protein [Caulobacterales bacterium]
MANVETLWPRAELVGRPGGHDGRARAVDGRKLFREIISSRLAAGAGLHAAKFTLRAALAPVATLRWLRALERLRAQTGVEELPFDLARKSGRAFLHHALGRAARIRMLEQHYAQLLNALGPAFVSRILGGEQIPLAELTGKSGRRYRLVLGRDGLFSKEGELVVSLFREAPVRRVVSLSFVVGALAAGGAADLVIGGLQGGRSVHAKSDIGEATKDLWGLRPKNLVVDAAYGLAHRLGAASLRAVSNRGHVLRGVGARGVRISADYDAFWRELGGALTGAGYYLLPNVRRRRAEAEVAPAKRKAWRARYALLDDVTARIRGLSDVGAGEAD